MTSMISTYRLAGVLVALAGVALTAGQAQQPPPPLATDAPTFKAQVEYVEVDALVTDEQGNFVRNLTRDDFQVFEDGRRQTIAAFSLVDIPIEAADRPLYAAGPIEPDVQTNARPFDGRVYVLILDDLHTDALRSQRVKLAARQFIERHLGANDLMAVVHTGGRSQAAQEFTSNKRLLLRAVDQFVGRKLPSATLARNDEYWRQRGLPQQDLRINDPYDVERGHNARASLEVVQKIAEWFGGVRGRRKTILFVSEGIDYDITDLIRSPFTPAGMASAVLDDIRVAIAATARSNVSIYSIDPRGLSTLGDDTIGVTGFADADPGGGASPDGTPGQSGRGIGMSSLRNEQMLAHENLRALAEETNGFAVINRNDYASAFERIVRDNSSYYVLAYYPPNNKRDGKFHRIEVKVDRPGLSVRARRGYVAPRGNTPARKPPAPGDASHELLDALNSPLPVSGLTMAAFAAPFKGPAPKASVLLGLELLGRDLSLLPNGKIELSYVVVDNDGKTHGAKTDTLTTNLRPETRTRVEQTGFRVLNRLELEPGRYQVRVASHDPGAALAGSVIFDLEVPDFHKQKFSMSGLVLTSMSGSTLVTVKPDEDLKAVLPAPPIGQRTFPQNDEIALFVEIYDNSGAIPHKVDIVAQVRGDDGTVYLELEDERDSRELEGGRGGYGYTARIPVSEFAPGAYVLSVTARSRIGNDEPSSREVRFRVVPPLAAPPQ